MDSHKCKLCSRLFTNGRALGGHMKAHLTAAPALPLPPSKPPTIHVALPSSTSSSSAAADDSLESEHDPTLYEVRENPNTNFRFSDPVFDIVLQDRESETDSRNPTCNRSKRRRQPPLEPPEPASSVSYTSPEEDLAMCLMMLSRDRRIENQNQIPNQFEKIRAKKPLRRKKKCQKCTKHFRSYRALFSHEKICQLKTELEEEEEEEEKQEHFKNGGNRRRIFKCPFCFKLFGSGQALGGHKRSHFVSSTNGGVSVDSSVSLKMEISLIDLNLPAPLEEDDYSVVSNA
ncbi:zinc finger protein ZAT4-like [Cucurbita maxima]|uniref:Zinc finger protein ZAT4-like n=1 Tax=Cucurbita maxima TaxID=3661 RepID=A0A6J1K1T6_CUCMA|nr:zinc finger protein ZAT4-like [Cucurbita maxima]